MTILGLGPSLRSGPRCRAIVGAASLDILWCPWTQNRRALNVTQKPGKRETAGATGIKFLKNTSRAFATASPDVVKVRSVCGGGDAGNVRFTRGEQCAHSADGEGGQADPGGLIQKVEGISKQPLGVVIHRYPQPRIIAQQFQDLCVHLCVCECVQACV